MRNLAMILLFVLLHVEPTKGQNSTEKYIDSLLLSIPSTEQINYSKNITYFNKQIQNFNTIIDSMLLVIEYGIYKDSFNITYKNKRYSYDNLLDYIEVKLLEDKEVLLNLDPVPTNPLASQFKTKLDSLKSIKFFIGDTACFEKAYNLRSDMNNLLSNLQKNDPYTMSSWYLQWQNVELNIKDNNACCYYGKNVLLRKEPNQYIPTIHNVLYQPFNRFTDIVKKIEYSIELAEFFQKYDRKQDVIACLSIFLSYCNDTIYNNYYYINRAMDLFSKMSRADNNFKQNFVYSELFKDSSVVVKQFNKFTQANNQLIIEEYFLHTYPLLMDLMQDYQTKMGFVQQYPLGEIIYELTLIKFKLSLIKIFYIEENFDKKFLLYPLSTSWINLRYTKDTSRNQIFEDYEIFKKAQGIQYLVWDHLTNLSNWQKSIELLDEFCALSIRKNEFNRVAPILDSFIKKHKYIGNLPKLFNYLDGRIYFEQRLYKKDSLAFQEFNDVYRRALFTDTTVKFSNHNSLLSNYDYFMEDYFNNKPSNTQEEFLKNSDSVFFYGYWADVNSPDISFNSGIDRSILVYKNESQIKVLERKKNTLQKSYDTSVTLYNKQLKINQNLSVENKQLSDQNDIIKGNLEGMKEDTNKLGIEKRALSATVLQLNIEKDTLKNQNERKNAELKSKDKEIDEKIWKISILTGIVIVLSIATLLVPAYIYQRKTKENKVKLESQKAEHQKVMRDQETEYDEMIKRQKIEHEEIMRIQQEENEKYNYKLQLDKATSDQLLFSSLAGDHDIDKFIDDITDYENYTNVEENEHFKSVLPKFADYYYTVKDARTNLTNTILEDYTHGMLSAQLYLYTSKRNVNIDFETPNFVGNNEIEKLEIPKFMLTSLISNCVKHGSNNRDNIKISVIIEKIKDTFYFTVLDDGVGFSSLNLANRKKNVGINLLLEQVKNSNEFNKGYKIYFDESCIANRKDTSGVEVKFKIVKK